MTPIRIVVIDDSAFMRKIITDMLSSDYRIEVVAAARNGRDGLQKIQEHKPDVVTLDVEMPVMDGITALQHIMKLIPTPVIMLSSATKEGTSKTVQAISEGAVEFITKPTGVNSIDIAQIKEMIITKVIVASQAKLVKKSPLKENGSVTDTAVLRRYSKSIVTIGASTGGPKALQRVLTDLPSNIPASLLIVQHMPPGFTKSLAERLDKIADIHIKEASHGEFINEGTAYIAPGNYHMKLKTVGTAHAVELTQENPRNGHRPAVDVLFESLAKVEKVNKISAVLTGMGNDGSHGINDLKESDPESIIIAEAEESSVVYGMPKAAVRTNHVNHIVHLHQVGDTITKLVNRSRGT
ncbi:protein-glutamate methylesterase/protein-glutamine glutaminase [Virgibacillus litoralis]|uniref:Protein-glutamate methylesterase/protein-glutamine glutaminase n=1 Tax=Virgibacillus litoralis TaxID=578221 RepID=A0ABS4HEH8_9BACI|nr:chemotaxis response regulator protein-glutamate methylesterase [Virgibacillus litoralis]MBP1949144.1 two-component system chemotaxis response regulator CheB [Virgibacillus litoralis]